jgi:integrase-like protein
MENRTGEWGGSLSIARRRYQRGSLTKESDRWLGRWREDVADDTGAVRRVRRKQLIGTTADFPTKRLAMRELERRLDSINSEEYRPTRHVTFAVFAQRWMDAVLVHQKRSSQSSARSYIRVHLLPAFGTMCLADIRMEVIQQFVTNSKKSPKTLRNVVVTLMSMWNTAQAWEYVQHNPFPRGASGRLLLKLPAPRPAETYHFTVEEALAIIDKARGPWKTFFRVLAETGMRPGELAGFGALLSSKGTRPAESPEAITPDILAHPAIQAEIARQLALALRRQPGPIAEEPRCLT